MGTWIDFSSFIRQNLKKMGKVVLASSIWSHYSEFESKIDISGEKTISDYVISSMQSSNYRGTMVHEMLHQLGAIDLYPVHDEVSSIPWKGIGAWDLMASGNWNGQRCLASATNVTNT